jgi:hypothetical protein
MVHLGIEDVLVFVSATTSLILSIPKRASKSEAFRGGGGGGEIHGTGQITSLSKPENQIY